jgi:peptidoglycan/LPS O-acetylase OafA/YrhL
MIVGAIYLLSFSGGVASLLGMTRWDLTAEGVKHRMRFLYIGMWTMAITSWATVITGTYIVYPWYRAKAATSPRSELLAKAATAGWHNFGMEWKEHVAWLAPILATAAAMIVLAYGKELAKRPGIRRATLTLFVLAFSAAGVAGVFGAFLNKAAPIL